MGAGRGEGQRGGTQARRRTSDRGVVGRARAVDWAAVNPANRQGFLTCFAGFEVLIINAAKKARHVDFAATAAASGRHWEKSVRGNH